MAFNPGDIFSQTYTVTETVHANFIALSNDRNLLHTDEAYAKSKNFAGRVMHGNILNAFLSHFIGACLSTQEVLIHSQQIDYKKPVYLNDVLHLEAVVSGVFESVQATELKFKFKNGSGLIVAQGKIQIGRL